MPPSRISHFLSDQGFSAGSPGRMPTPVRGWEALQTPRGLTSNRHAKDARAETPGRFCIGARLLTFTKDTVWGAFSCELKRSETGGRELRYLCRLRAGEGRESSPVFTVTKRLHRRAAQGGNRKADGGKSRCRASGRARDEVAHLRGCRTAVFQRRPVRPEFGAFSKLSP